MGFTSFTPSYELFAAHPEKSPVSQVRRIGNTAPYLCGETRRKTMSQETMQGRAVFRDGIRCVEIDYDTVSGLILAVRSRSDLADAGRLIFPGFIDLHVHAREYAAPADTDPDRKAAHARMLAKETFATAGAAAINGGVVLYAAMPNDPEPPDDRLKWEAKRALTKTSACPVIVMGCVTERSEPFADIPYKLYLDSRASISSFDHWRNVEEALSRYRGMRVFFHAEDPDALREAPSDGPRWRTRPAHVEIRAVKRLLELVGRYGIRAHMCHISTRGALDAIADFNATASTKVTCEITPHHLGFSILEDRPRPAFGESTAPVLLMGSNPPIREEEDRRFCVEALRTGLADILATDHAPHTREDKAAGAPGIPHLDTVGPFAGALMTHLSFTPERITEILAAGPARICAKEAGGYGEIVPGRVASFTVLNLRKDERIIGGAIEGRGPLRTKSGWSCFEGMSLPARVEEVVVFGKRYTFAG
jgi:dihydroorotase